MELQTPWPVFVSPVGLVAKGRNISNRLAATDALLPFNFHEASRWKAAAGIGRVGYAG